MNEAQEKEHYQSLRSLVAKKINDEETQIENERYAVSEQFQQTENTANFLFKGLTFYISRECPQYAMEFIVMSMSGTIVDEPEKATHIVTDRSPEHIVFKKNKEYI